MSARVVTTRGGVTALPRLVYGTAWKAEATADLVYAAVRAGFRGIDTAAQPRHYREDLVAQGVRRAIADGLVSRADLYLQTKYTPIGGQDPDNLPYDPEAPLAEQVRTSVASSLKNFTVVDGDEPYIDCLVLHSPLARPEDTRTVWAALEAFVPSQIRSLGVSNVILEQLQDIVESARIAPPVVVQNRFYRRTAHDVALRRYCGDPTRQIVYQSFWTLTANDKLLGRKCVQAVARGAGVDTAVAFYALLILGLGKTPANGDGLCPVVTLDGTKTEEHMTGHLAGLGTVEAWAEGSGKAEWAESVAALRALIGETET